MRYFQQCPHCGGKAWEWREKPYSGMKITAASVIHKGNPKPGDPTTCQECGARLSISDLKAKFLIEENES